MKIERISPVTGKLNVREIDVEQAQIDYWKAGMFIQNAMPNVSAADLEFIMTGCTEEDWDLLWGEESIGDGSEGRE